MFSDVHPILSILCCIEGNCVNRAGCWPWGPTLALCWCSWQAQGERRGEVLSTSLGCVLYWGIGVIGREGMYLGASISLWKKEQGVVTELPAKGLDTKVQFFQGPWGHRGYSAHPVKARGRSL